MHNFTSGKINHTYLPQRTQNMPFTIFTSESICLIIYVSVFLIIIALDFIGSAIIG